jgi:hypothetical protein
VRGDFAKDQGVAVKNTFLRVLRVSPPKSPSCTPRNPMSKKIEVLSHEVRLSGVNDQDYVCLTDIARYKETIHTDDLIRNWLRNRNTLEFLGLWEQINNPGFNPVEFDGFKKQAGRNLGKMNPLCDSGSAGVLGKIKALL